MFNSTGGLPDGFRRVVNTKTGNIEVLGRDGALYIENSSGLMPKSGGVMAGQIEAEKRIAEAAKGTIVGKFDYLKLSDRHLLDRLSIPKATGNSLFTGTKAEALGDLAEIKSGTAIKNGEYFTTSSGRVWGIHNNSVHPVSGPSVVNISSQEYKILSQAKKQGQDSAMTTLSHLEKNKILSSEQVERTKSILNLMKDKK